MNCARCGHDIYFHGRRGHGACRAGRTSQLARAVHATVAAVQAGLSEEERKAVIDKVMNEPHEPCKCPRFRKTPIKKEKETP